MSVAIRSVIVLRTGRAGPTSTYISSDETIAAMTDPRVAKRNEPPFFSSLAILFFLANTFPHPLLVSRIEHVVTSFHASKEGRVVRDETSIEHDLNLLSNTSWRLANYSSRE